MLIRFSPNPIQQAIGIIRFNWINIVSFLLLSTGVAIGSEVLKWKIMHIDLAPISILGSALAIFLAFRNNAAYDMWWEGRKIWGGVVNISRTWAMETMSMVTLKHTNGEITNEEKQAFQQELIYRHLAWINALRLQLRKQDAWEELKPFLTESEFELIQNDKNRATMLLHRQGLALEKAEGLGLIEDFRHMQMDNRLKEMYDLQGKAERIKNTIFPFYYSYFTRLFLWLFLILLPFALVPMLGWLVIPIATAVSFVFTMLEKTGVVTEDPFENRAADIPLTSLCRTIEIDMRQQLGEDNLPEGHPIMETSYGGKYQI